MRSLLAIAASGVTVMGQHDWPRCIEQNTVIRNAGKAFFTNVAGYGAAAGCFLDDCKNTDKFAVSSLESCLNVCNSEPECAFWVFGTEEGIEEILFQVLS